jgi:putative methyltransferase (TIGR04325 family)
MPLRQTLRATLKKGLSAVAGNRLVARALRPAFERRPGTCWGVFDTFEEAVAASPRSRALGYDNEEAAGLYRELHATVEPNEYAVAFWLQRRLQPGHRILDFGGHVGIKYYAIQTVLPLPDGVTWIVCDVPALVTAGRRLAAEREAKSLLFTETLAGVSGVDVFLALGSLQYLEAPLPRLLQTMPALPRFVIVSSTPMSDRPRYFTIQNIGAAYCPYLIENRESIVCEMHALGYELVQSWSNPEKRCGILGRPDRSVYGYSSMHFALRSRT